MRVRTARSHDKIMEVQDNERLDWQPFPSSDVTVSITNFTGKMILVDVTKLINVFVKRGKK